MFGPTPVQSRHESLGSRRRFGDRRLRGRLEVGESMRTRRRVADRVLDRRSRRCGLRGADGRDARGGLVRRSPSERAANRWPTHRRLPGGPAPESGAMTRIRPRSRRQRSRRLRRRQTLRRPRPHRPTSSRPIRWRSRYPRNPRPPRHTMPHRETSSGGTPARDARSFASPSSPRRRRSPRARSSPSMSWRRREARSSMPRFT